MPANDSSTKVTAVMPSILKTKLKQYAESKRWTMSQAIVYLVEKGLDEETEETPKRTKSK